jgi:hypothetical protein
LYRGSFDCFVDPSSLGVKTKDPSSCPSPPKKKKKNPSPHTSHLFPQHLSFTRGGGKGKGGRGGEGGELEKTLPQPAASLVPSLGECQRRSGEVPEVAKRRNLREATKFLWSWGWEKNRECWCVLLQPPKVSNLGGNRLGTLLVTRKRGGQIAAARPLSCKVGNRLPPAASALGSRRCYCPEQQQPLLLLLGDCASEGVDSQRGERERESSWERRDFLLLLLCALCRVVSCRVGFVLCCVCVWISSTVSSALRWPFKACREWSGIKEVAGEEPTSRTQVRETGEL